MSATAGAGGARAFTILIAAAAISVVCGCSVGRGGWDASGLEERHPLLSEADSRGHRLVDTPPYFLLDSRGALLFLCRWSTDAPIRVSLPTDASANEQSALRIALAAWEGAGIGVRFREVAPAAADIQIDFTQDDPEASVALSSGDTIADCAVPVEIDQEPDRERVPANLSYASIHLRRANLDLIGELVPLTPEELIGSALHELGHSLGYAGHPVRGSSVMVRNVERVRRIGRKVLAGETFSDPTLTALYALPSGTVVGRIDLDPEVTHLAVDFGRRARAAGWVGPFVRVGEYSARLLWRDPAGRSGALEIFDWSDVLRHPDRFGFASTPRARALLSNVGAPAQ